MAAANCSPQSQRNDPRISPVKHCAWMRSNGATAVVGSPRVIASAALALPFAPSCTYPVALNRPHFVGMSVDAMRRGGPVSMPLAMRLRRTFRCFRNGAARAQAVDFGRVESQFLENLIVVLADFRSALCGHFGDAMHLNRTADRRSNLAASALHRDDDVIRSQRWTVHHPF